MAVRGSERACRVAPPVQTARSSTLPAGCEAGRDAEPSPSDGSSSAARGWACAAASKTASTTRGQRTPRQGPRWTAPGPPHPSARSRRRKRRRGGPTCPTPCPCSSSRWAWSSSCGGRGGRGGRHAGRCGRRHGGEMWWEMRSGGETEVRRGGWSKHKPSRWRPPAWWVSSASERAQRCLLRHAHTHPRARPNLNRFVSKFEPHGHAWS